MSRPSAWCVVASRPVRRALVLSAAASGSSRPVIELNGVPANVDQVSALAMANYAHYTSMRVDDLQVRGLSRHLQRLVQDCRLVFDAELDPERVRSLIRRVLVEAPRSVVVRVTVFDPGLEIAHPGADAEPHLLVITRPAPGTSPQPVRLQSAPYRRELPAVKHAGLFGSLWWRRIAQRNGFDDVLFTDAHATISEAATANIGLLAGEKIIWPEADCLAGVTMRLINLVWDNTATAPITLDQLAEVDAVFVTNAVFGVRPVAAVDGIQFPIEHPVLRTLCQQYSDTPVELV